MKLLTILLAFLGTSLFAQIPDSCICYTDEMDKIALECLVNKAKKDSIITNLTLQIINFKEVIQNDNTIKTDLRTNNEVLKAENHQLNLKLTKAKKNMPYFAVGGFAVGVGATIFIFKKVAD